jgi:hypothetical protein
MMVLFTHSYIVMNVNWSTLLSHGQAQRKPSGSAFPAR